MDPYGSGEGSHMDIAVNLVESYLRLNGYLTLSEFEIQARNERGIFESVTDVDIMAIRFPGDVFVSDPHDGVEARMLAIEDPALLLEPDQIDVIIGEVKQGNAQFNPRPSSPPRAPLHAAAGGMDVRRRRPQSDRRPTRPAQPVHGPRAQRGMIRVRLVAFGRSDYNDLNTLSHGHIVTTMLGFLSGLDDAFRPVQFRDPAPAMLNLLVKSGFLITRPPVV